MHAKQIIYCMALAAVNGRPPIADGSMVTDLSDVTVDLTYMNDILPTFTGFEICFNPITINLRIIAAYT
jgi:hypothetical protein